MSSELLEEFIFDAREHLSIAGSQLMALENNPASLEALNSLMGTLHTIKGNSGFVNLRHLYELLHAGESLLQTVRETGDRRCPTAAVECLFQILDTAEAVMRRLENGEDDDVDWLPALMQSITETEASLEEPAPGGPGPGPPQEAGDGPDLSLFGSDGLKAGASPAREPAPGPSFGRPDPDLVLDSLPAIPGHSLSHSPPPPGGQGESPPSPSLVSLADGQIDHDRESFRSNCRRLASGGHLTLDLRALTQVSSAEMDMLSSLGRDLGDRLSLMLKKDSQPHFWRLFCILGLSESFRFFSGPDELARG